MKKFKMPSAFTIVFIALLITAILTYFIPVSVFDAETGKVVVKAVFDESDNIVNLGGAGTQPAGVWDFVQAPIQGFQNASDVAIALLIAGGFLNVLNYTGGLEAGIGKLLNKFTGAVLIAVMTTIFALLGTVFGLWEEIPAFAVVIIPLFVIAGYDVMTGIGVLFVGATVGNMASVVNPFSVGAAVAALGNPELSLGSGIILRIIIFVVLNTIATFYLIKYANSVKKFPEKSIIAELDDVNSLTDDNQSELPEFNRQRFLSALVFILIVVFMIIGYIPWSEFGLSDIVNAPITALNQIPVIGSKNFTPFGEWYFNEFSFLFFIGAFFLKIINKIPEAKFFKLFLDGSKDLLGVVVVLGIARGISILMGSKTSGMSVTLVYWISEAMANVPLWVFAIVAIFAFMAIGVFLQSTSGVASISMPILGAVAAAIFAATSSGEIGGQIILMSAFTIGLNFTSCIFPSATVMGTLELVNVPYNYYLKFVLKIYILLTIVGGLIISIAPYIGLV
ncbi:YfcC family protein [Mycoplasma sp. P36-A1]|uniref:YfcC family protein n=1 Tax=Mycoplasma sp. P36-A1 TaxID=3252900 RepID=UPI003C2ADAC2